MLFMIGISLTISEIFRISEKVYQIEAVHCYMVPFPRFTLFNFPTHLHHLYTTP